MSKVRDPPPISAKSYETDMMECVVLLQAMKEEPATDAKCKDKFLVQSVAVTGGDMEYSNVTSIVRHLRNRKSRGLD
jgi:hypothetical protein